MDGYLLPRCHPSAKAVQTALENVKEELSGGVGDLSTTVDGLVGDVETIQGQLSATGTTGQAIAAAQAQADKGVADAAAAKAAADAAQADANANADAISKLDTTYVSESEMNSFKTSNTSAIAAAKSEAITEAANAAKIYIDADELEASQTAQDTILKKYADDAAAAVGTAASGALTNALADYSTTAQMNSAIASADTALETKVTNAYKAADTALETSLKSYADTAEADAIAAAATDATTKANAAQAAAIAASDSKGSAAQALTDAKAFTTEQIEALGKLATVDTACASGVTDCALVIRSGEIKWEKVSY